jgi:hypothetical protein
LSTPTLQSVGSTSIQPLTFAGLITVPTVPFSVAAAGTTADGQRFAVHSSSMFTPMNMSIGFSPSVLRLAPGSASNTQLTIYNGGGPATFTIKFNDPNGLLSSNPSVSVNIGPSTSASVPVTVTYPTASSSVIGPTVTATASVDGDASRAGTATLTLWQSGAL